MARTTCEGKRRMWRGNRFGTFKCGRKAVGVVETHVGLTKHHYVCDLDECYDSVRGGYPASFRALSK